MRVFNEAELAGNKINGVYHIIVGDVEEECFVCFGVQPGDGADLAAGGNVPDPVGHHLGLVLPQGRVEGAELAVQIGEAYGVIVHQSQLPHAASGQRFDGKASHAANAEDGHVTVGQPLQGGSSQGHFLTEKRMFHVIVPRNRWGCCKGGRV
ncbi:unknown [Firmicutes bacterium CAG:137]|nr:unknown [Firmicutes bacterium CAG:137]